MSKVSMQRCDVCGAVADEMADGVIRISQTHELRINVCDEDIARLFEELEPSPRRGRREQVEA